MKIKFDSDDNLPLNKTVEMRIMAKLLELFFMKIQKKDILLKVYIKVQRYNIFENIKIIMNQKM